MEQNRDENAKKMVYIGADVQVVGEIRNASGVEIDGKFEGTLVTDGLKVGANGNVEGDLAARRLEVKGKASGTIVIQERLAILPSGKVEGDIVYGSLEISEGGEICGSIRREAKPAAPAGGGDQRAATPGGGSPAGDKEKPADTSAQKPDTAPSAAATSSPAGSQGSKQAE